MVRGLLWHAPATSDPNPNPATSRLLRKRFRRIIIIRQLRSRNGRLERVELDTQLVQRAQETATHELWSTIPRRAAQ